MWRSPSSKPISPPLTRSRPPLTNSPRIVWTYWCATPASWPTPLLWPKMDTSCSLGSTTSPTLSLSSSFCPSCSRPPNFPVPMSVSSCSRLLRIRALPRKESSSTNFRRPWMEGQWQNGHVMDRANSPTRCWRENLLIDTRKFKPWPFILGSWAQAWTLMRPWVQNWSSRWCALCCTELRWSSRRKGATIRFGLPVVAKRVSSMENSTSLWASWRRRTVSPGRTRSCPQSCKCTTCSDIATVLPVFLESTWHVGRLPWSNDANSDFCRWEWTQQALEKYWGDDMNKVLFICHLSIRPAIGGRLRRCIVSESKDKRRPRAILLRGGTYPTPLTMYIWTPIPP